MTTSFAYIHCKPDGTPFYVGKGVRTRYKNFSQRNQWHKRVVAKYGAENILIGKIDCSSNDTALELEIGLIKCLRRMGFSLANFTDGGQGALGRKCLDKTRKAISEANKNRVFTPELRYKAGSAFRGKKRPEHSKLMKERGHWLKEQNPFFGKGDQQTGAKNHMAKKIVGEHNNCVSREWETMQQCAHDLGVSIQAVSQAIRKKHRSKGWQLERSK
jgi:hypothetical protein